VSTSTPRVFWTFLLGGAFVSFVIVWLTDPLLIWISRPDLSYDPLPLSWIGALALTLVWVLPAQAFVGILATLYFSFHRRLPMWFVIGVLIPLGVLIVTYRHITDSRDWVERHDYRKLLYWTLVVAPAELLCARHVAKKIAASERPANPPA